ncbi:MAG: transglutaminase-like domain-containing protein [Limnochordales bacterium]|nr:transglutaminase-like domain-containing protein [Limnochordales bacterium]
MRRLTGEDIQALIRLMGDSDMRTATFAREKLLEAEVEDVLPHLKNAVSDADPLIRGRARLFLEELRLADLNRRWALLASQPDTALDLETGAFLVAKYRYPEVDMTPYRRWLDEQAAAVAANLDPDMSMYRTIGLLNMQLFEKAGLQGDDVRYYDPDNSCLNRVIDRKRGIPITLSVIYLLVGQRLGLPLQGVGLPGHFLVRYSDNEETIWIDPFHRGRLLTREDCIRHVRAMGYPFREHFLKPLKPRAILVRMLGNLHRIFVETEQPLQAEHIKGFQDILTQKG